MVSELTRQRDELLAACKLAITQLDYSDPNRAADILILAIRKIRIAQVEGK